MITISDLEAVFSHLIEAQLPHVDSLPEGSSSTDWIRAQNLVEARVETATGKVIGIASDGIPVLAALAKGMRTANPQYARGTRLRSFITQLVSEIVNLKRGRAGGAIQPQDLTILQDSMAEWFASVAIPRKHLVPCSILPDPATTFSVGPVQFLHATAFDPKTFGLSAEMAEVSLEPLYRSMNERAASWLAIVEVDACEPDRSNEIAGLAVDVALAALQLIVPLDYFSGVARITGRTLPPYTASLVCSSAGISPGIRNSQPGLGFGGEAFDHFVSHAASVLSSAGDRISTFLTRNGKLPKLQMAWCDASFWFHEAVAEPLDTVAIAKLETSIENLFAAGNPTESTSRILQALKGVFGLGENDPIAPGSLVKVRAFVADVVTARSRILHGTWSTLTDEVPLGRGEVAILARQLLVTYTLMLDSYGPTAAPVDKAQAFLNWIEAERARQSVGTAPAAGTPPRPPA